MGCNTDGNPMGGSGFFQQPVPDHCYNCVPEDGATVQVWTYPTQNKNLNWPDVDRDAIMYGSSLVTAITPETLAAPPYCGKDQRLEYTSTFSYSSTTGSSSTYRVWEHYPNALSHYPIDSDTWFAFLYDTSNFFVGTPCKNLKYYKRDTTSSNTTESTDPQTGETTATTTSTTTTDYYWVCEPCAASEGTCVPKVTTVTYSTPGGNISGDATQPFPTIYTAHTNTNRIAFKYNSLSTTQTNSADTLSLTIDGTTYDAWSSSGSTGKITSTQGNWTQSDGGTQIIQELTDEANGLRYTIRIEPIITDLTNDVYTFGGSEFSIINVSNYGSGYTVGDSISGSYDSFTWSLGITGVTNRTVAAGAAGTLMSAGDTVNGHTVTDVFHSDVENFLWHIAILDGGGSNFAKDTSYTTGNGFSINVAAGKGIKDRAMITGLYEFRAKEIQYVIAELDPDVPNYYDDMVQPNVTASVSGGKVTGVTIVSGGSGWEKLEREPILIITPPQVSSGTPAKIKGNFSGGVLQSVAILDGGSGYSSTSPPNIVVADVNGVEDVTIWESIGDPETDPAMNLLREVDEVNDQGKYNHITEIKSDEVDFAGASSVALDDQTIDGTLVKYTRPTKFKSKDANYTVKSVAKQEYERIFTNDEDLEEFLAYLDENKYTYTLEKLSGKRMSTFIGEAKSKLQSDYKEVGVGKVTKIDPGETTSQKDAFDQREEVFVQIDETKTKPLVKNIRKDPNNKRYHDVGNTRFTQDTINSLPKTTENPQQVFGDHPIKGLDKEFQKSLDLLDEMRDNLLDEKSTVEYDESEIRTVRVSFSRLPCPNRYIKYYIRQFKPDKSQKAKMNITLSCNVDSISCSGLCPELPEVPAFGGGTSNPTTGQSTSLTLIETRQEGSCTNWTASGTVDIYNNLTGSAALFAQAVSKFGNPFDSLCD